MKKLIFLIFIITQFTDAQNKKELFLKLIDSEDSSPISFATIIIKNSNLGVIADYNGEARIPLQYYKNNNSIILSSIGYTTQEVSLKNLKTDQINVLKIIPQVEALYAVVVNSRSKIRGLTYNVNNLTKASRRLSAIEIVRKAIEKIPQNLSDQPHSYMGYYRDYQLVDNEFYNLNEGIFETYDKGINSNFLKENEAPTAIYNFKQNINFNQDNSLTEAYNGTTKYIEHSTISPRGGNEYTILNTHNPIRNFRVNTFSYVYNLKTDFTYNHDFKKEDIVFADNEPLILIKFKKSQINNNSIYGLKNITSPYVDGTIYISLVDYSIHRFNYKAFFPGTKKVLFNVSLEYARQNNKMYLNYITFNNAFVAGEGYELREEEVIFDKNKQAFFITFNNTKDFLNTETLKKNNFKFKLANKNLETVSVEKISEREIKVDIKSYYGLPIEIDKTNIGDLSYKFKRIEDVKGRVIYETRNLEGDQFREFFVQRVHLNKSPPKDLDFMNQNAPLIKSPLNNFPDANQYWINSPLMNKKYREVEKQSNR